MINKNDLNLIEKELEAGRKKKAKLLALMAPSFVAEFEYPEIISQLKQLGFDKVVELTFGAKLVNKEYHKILENPKNKDKLFIASVCPGTVKFIQNKYPNYTKGLMPVDSPMIATAKVCKKFYKGYKTIFVSPCHYKKIEAQNSKYLDYVIDYQQLGILIKKYDLKSDKKQNNWDRFYNDYTKIYPLSGGLSKTAHVKGILDQSQSIVLDGIEALESFLKNPDKKIRFIDTSFCIGGCIGGPCLFNKNLKQKKKRLLRYLDIAKREKIPKSKKGIFDKAKGIDFKKEY